MADDPKITPMQQKVLAELHKGKKAAEISKKLKITPSGVYGHIRRMKEAGVQIPGQDGVVVTPAPRASKPPAIEVPSTWTNGTSNIPDPEKALRAALSVGTARIEAINAEVDQLSARIAELGAERETVISTGRRHERALAAVLGDEGEGDSDAASSFFATAEAE